MAYLDRLRPPLSWWVVGLVVGATFVVAVAVFLGPVAFAVMSLLVVAVVSAVLVAAGQTTVVDETGITVGRSTLPWAYVGTVVPHDRDGTRERVGPAADPSAYLAFRGFAGQSVEVQVTDPADPHPYWLVSTRDAHRLADAVEAARATT